MKEIGRIIKERREEKEISLDDAHKFTKIQERYLVAIEEGDMSAFFAEVYYKSFVRSYANYLGLDPEELIERLNTKKQEREKEFVVQENPKDNKKDIKKLLIGVTSVIVVALFLFFIYMQKHISNIPSFGEIPLQNDRVNDQNEFEKEVSQESSLVADIKQKLDVEAKSTVWIKVDCDNVTVYEGIITKGNKKSWEADKSFTLKIGYVPGVKVIFNGDKVDVLTGAVRDVNTIVLKRQQ
jgi:cytoskeletal protein RodZ